MIVCTSCGNHNEDSDEFCGSCGKFLEWVGERIAAPEPDPEPEPEVQEEEPVKVGIVGRVKAAVGIDEAGRPAAALPGGPEGSAGPEGNGAATAPNADGGTEQLAAAEAERAAAEAEAEAAAAAIAAEAAATAAAELEEANRRAAAEEESRRAAEAAARDAEAKAAAEALAAARAADDEARQRAQAEARARWEAEERARKEAAEAEAAAKAAAEAQDAERAAAQERAAREAEEARQAAEALETARRAEAEAKARAAEEAKARADAEAKARADEEARRRAEAEAKAKAEEEARARAEAEAKAKAEEEARAEAARRAAALLATPKAQSPTAPAADPPRERASTPSAVVPEAKAPTAQAPAKAKQQPRPPRPKQTAAEAAEIKPGDLICGECGTGNDPARKFCRKCGASLAAAVTAAKLPWWKRVFSRKHKKSSRSAKELARSAQATSWKVTRVMMFARRGLMLLAFAGLAVPFAIPSTRGIVLGKADDLLQAVKPDSFEPVNPKQMSASSQLPDHPAQAARDNFTNTYWAEAAPGPGVGERITFEFDPTTIARTLITSGNPEQFVEQPRPKVMQVIYDEGIAPQPASETIQLKDVQKAQTIALKPPGEVTRVTFVVLEVYPGSGGEDLAVTEFEFRLRKP